MKRTLGTLGAFVGFAGLLYEPAAAQSRVVVPIVIQVPRAVPSRSPATSSSIHVTTSSQLGSTVTTRVTVRDTSGAGRSLGTPPTARALATAPIGAASVRGTTGTRVFHPGTTTTRVTVRDTSGAGRNLGVSPAARMQATAPIGTSSVLVTVDRSPGRPGTDDLDRTHVTVRDVSAAGRTLGGPVSTSSVRTAGSGQQTWTITSDAPIDAPIVILGH